MREMKEAGTSSGARPRKWPLPGVWMFHRQGMFVAPQGSGTRHKRLRCSRLCILVSGLPFLQEPALPPAPRDVLLQTLSPTALRPLWPNPPCKQLQ
ncbi:uncharacterized protein LOC128812344 isoform X2 [Vidua macroura]|uniref:uncharacterized protein LOC128812344 isoform X2 n=1 Tax=Vidua macroura TaxID=187451 RepID=UPI0023A8BF45|nr:uncharacterized protein LOC128812344 isoform X2 [Vidua macroura]